MNMQQNQGQDIEISERANGFRRIVEKFRDRVRGQTLERYSEFLSQ